jgi:hypothetical protein
MNMTKRELRIAALAVALGRLPRRRCQLSRRQFACRGTGGKITGTRTGRDATTKALTSGALAVVLAGCGAAALSHRPAPVRVTITHVVTAQPTVLTVTPKPRAVTVTDTPTAATAPANAPASPPAQAPNPGLSDPVAVVTQFYADISAGDYSAAWALGGDNIAGTDYTNWVAGYGTTASISVSSAEDFGSDQASATISAVQTDGSVRNYHGTYTVQNGVIVGADITQE